MILLTGASGKLGQAICQSGLFPNLLSPTHKEMDIIDHKTVDSFFEKYSIDTVIHAAALARMAECEKDPSRALKTNTLGTLNMVTAILEKEKKRQKNIRMIYISTDGVYAGKKGNYSEHDETIPYNMYGWTKLGGECAVRMLSNYCIIRTSFFDPTTIRFDTSAIDSYSSKMPLSKLVEAIAKLVQSNFIGVINIGDERKSDYERFKFFKKDLKPCTQKDILTSVSFPMAEDASLNCKLWEKLK